MSAAPKMAENPLLDKNLINAFVDGVKKTLSTMANTECKPGKPFVEKNYQAKGDISGMIGMVSGNMKGTMTISFIDQTIFAVLQNMFGETHTAISPEVTDAVGELTNMIYGTAKTTLNEKGYDFKMAIPQVITGKHQINSYHNGATLVIPFDIGDGKSFFIEITVEV